MGRLRPRRGCRLDGEPRSPGGGTLSAASTPTDSAGEARTQWTLGAAAGTHTVTASVAGLPAASVTATAVLPQPAKLEAAGGDAAGSRRTYTRADLRAGGFPTDVVVTR